MNILLKNKQLLYLFLCNFAIVFIGFGLFPILPLYAAEFGATPSMIGVYLAITYIAISLGSILAGQLSNRIPRMTLFTAAGLLGTPALFLLGHAQNYWTVVFLTALVWFAGGVGLSVSSVLTGLHTNSSTRGKAFGLLALASPLGALIGGLIVSFLVNTSGYRILFYVLAIEWSMYPILALTKVREPDDCAPLPALARSKSSTALPGTSFLFLLLTVLLASMTVSVVRMGTSLSMKGIGFTASEVSTANAIGGLITIPVTLLIGMLSDKLGRKTFLLLGYVVAMAGSLILVGAQTLWQFWMVSSLVLAARSVISSMAPAYATDILHRRTLGKALPLVGTMNWVSGVIGFAGSGFVLDTYGEASLYGAGSVLAIVSAIIIAFLPTSLKIRPMPVVAAVNYLDEVKVSRC